MLERVYTVTDFYDCPRGGVADFEGAPHSYALEWDDDADDYADTYRLRPISDATLKLVLECWVLWERWARAFHAGAATLETHPALPEDRARYFELKALLEPDLRIDPNSPLRARGEFRRAPCWINTGIGPYEVSWERC